MLINLHSKTATCKLNASQIKAQMNLARGGDMNPCKVGVVQSFRVEVAPSVEDTSPSTKAEAEAFRLFRGKALLLRVKVARSLEEKADLSLKDAVARSTRDERVPLARVEALPSMMDEVHLIMDDQIRSIGGERIPSIGEETAPTSIMNIAAVD